MLDHFITGWLVEIAAIAAGLLAYEAQARHHAPSGGGGRDLCRSAHVPSGRRTNR